MPLLCPCGHDRGEHEKYEEVGRTMCTARLCPCMRFGDDLPAPSVRLDIINHPPHYKRGGTEAIDVLTNMMTHEEVRGFLWGNLFKYIWRWQERGGIEDLKKAQWYLARMIAQEEEK